MSVTVQYFRSNGGPEELMVSREEPPFDAVLQMVVYELGYGGTPSITSPTEIQVRTNVLNCRDRSVFRGTPSDLRPLMEALAYWYHPEIRGKREVATEVVAEAASRLGWKTILQANLGPIMVGRSTVVAVLACVMGPDCFDRDPEALADIVQRGLCSSSTRDFEAALSLAYEEKSSLWDVLEALDLVKPPPVGT